MLPKIGTAGGPGGNLRLYDQDRYQTTAPSNTTERVKGMDMGRGSGGRLGS